MKIINKVLLCYFNLSGITNLSVHKKQVAISKTMISINLFTIPLLTLLLNLLAIPIESSKNINASKFASKIVSTFGIQYLIITIFTIYFCVWNQKNVLRLIQACIRLFNEFKLSTETVLFSRFEKRCYFNFFSTITVIFLTKMAFALASFRRHGLIPLFIFQWYENTALVFMIFVSFFPQFFLILLQHLNLQIETISKLKMRKVLSYDSLSLKFIGIHNLVAKFNKVFGLHLSMVSFFAIAVTTIRVR